MKHSKRTMSRRVAVGRLVMLATLGFLPASAAVTRSGSGKMPKLDPQSERALKFGYAHDASETARPNDTQRCARCTHFTPDGNGGWGRCNIFVGSRVNAGGWCRAFHERG